MIQVTDLTRRYGDFTAVDRVSFRIDRGEVIGLLGHNGAGKTTIMKMLTGYLEPTSGTITIDGLTMGPDTRDIQARIGYLPENCPVWPDMLVIEFLEYQAMLHGVAPEKRPAAIARAIRRTGLKPKANARIQTLSRGYRQRVGVAQAILHDPDIVILDEPTNGLDPTQIHHMRDLIRELSKTATVIVSTHILQEVQAICQRVLIMRAGQLVEDSTLQDLQKDHALLVAVQGDATASLSSVQGVSAFTELGCHNGVHRYRLEAEAALAPEVAAAITGAGLPLLEITPERQDLETVFARVNEEVAHA